MWKAKNQKSLSSSTTKIILDTKEGGGGTIAQSVERATLGEEVAVSIPAVAARSLQVRSVSV